MSSEKLLEFDLDSKLEEVFNQVVTTLSFHGVTIDKMELSELGVPSYNVTVSKQKMYQSLEDTLNFTYWVLWVLSYRRTPDETDSDLEIILNYTEVK